MDRVGITKAPTVGIVGEVRKDTEFRKPKMESKQRGVILPPPKMGPVPETQDSSLQVFNITLTANEIRQVNVGDAKWIYLMSFVRNTGVKFVLSDNHMILTPPVLGVYIYPGFSFKSLYLLNLTAFVSSMSLVCSDRTGYISFQ